MRDNPNKHEQRKNGRNEKSSDSHFLADPEDNPNLGQYAYAGLTGKYASALSHSDQHRWQLNKEDIVSQEYVDRFIGQLDSDHFSTRRKAINKFADMPPLNALQLLLGIKEAGKSRTLSAEVNQAVNNERLQHICDQLVSASAPMVAMSICDNLAIPGVDLNAFTDTVLPLHKRIGQLESLIEVLNHESFRRFKCSSDLQAQLVDESKEYGNWLKKQESNVELFGTEDTTDEHLSYLHLFPDAKELYLTGSQLTEKGMQYVQRLRRLECLYLGSSKLTDQGAKSFAGLKNLRELDLWSTEIGDEGLMSLQGLSRLVHLNLDDTHVTNRGMQYLASLHNLRDLHLKSTDITDEGLKNLSKLENIRKLDLENTQVTGAGLSDMQAGNMQSLNLSGTPFSDDGCKHLNKFINLKELRLDGTKITDQGLEHLAILKKLADLYVYDTSISMAAVARLKKALPFCTIYSNNDIPVQQGQQQTPLL